MIVVTYGTAGEARELICAGHAGYAAEGGGGKRPPGRCQRQLPLHRGGLRPAAAGGGDIVCAAASALCGGLAATLLKHKEDFASASVTEAPGYCRVACADEAAAPYFEFALVGLKKLAEAYPENVAVKLSDEREVSP